MRIAVFSDTHGHTEGMLRAITAERPDAVIHLGDCERDARAVSASDPDLPLYQVSGNCDFHADHPDTAFWTIDDVCVLATHGHRYGVKMSLDPMLNAAYFGGAKLVLFGHTHIPYNKEELGIRIMNPGTAGLGIRCTYGLIELINGMVLSCTTKPIPD